MIVEIAVCGTAAALFARGIYHSGVLTGWIAEGLMSTRPKAPPPRIAEKPAPVLPDPAIDDRRWRDMFLATPSAFWLDPNLWGDNPNWRADLPIAAPKPAPVKPIRAMMPRCPNCGVPDAVIVLTEHGGEATMWRCGACMAEFTKKGETRKSRKAHAAIRAAHDLNRRMGNYELDMPPPPMVSGTAWVNPQATMRMVEAHPAELPCGCSWNESIEYHQAKNGTTWTRCGRCEKWWEPPSNDGTHRRLAQGEHVHDKDYMNPTAQLVWERIWRNGTKHDGVCPSYLCQMPVAKRDGMYYCTSSDCRHSHKGWK
jgi:hypothetical protein